MHNEIVRQVINQKCNYVSLIPGRYLICDGFITCGIHYENTQSPAPRGSLERISGMLYRNSSSQTSWVTRTALSRILNGATDISPEMALRLEAAIGTSAWAPYVFLR